MPKKKGKKKTSVLKKSKKGTGAVVLKHQKVVEQMLENIGKGEILSVSKAAKQVGYTDSYANSSRLTKTKSWEELVAKHFPDEKLLKHHNQLLNAVDISHYIFPKSISDDEIIELVNKFGFRVIKISKYDNWKRAYFPIINARAKKDALDMMYKLTKRYETTINVKGAIGRLSDEEIEERIAEQISGVIGALAGEASEGGE